MLFFLGLIFIVVSVPLYVFSSEFSRADFESAWKYLWPMTVALLLLAMGWALMTETTAGHSITETMMQLDGQDNAHSLGLTAWMMGWMILINSFPFCLSLCESLAAMNGPGMILTQVIIRSSLLAAFCRHGLIWLIGSSEFLITVVLWGGVGTLLFASFLMVIKANFQRLLTYLAVFHIGVMMAIGIPFAVS